MPKQICGDNGAVLAIAPDDTWNLMEEFLPKPGIKVKACWAHYVEGPYQYAVLKVINADKEDIQWANAEDMEIFFPPDFWKPLDAG